MMQHKMALKRKLVETLSLLTTTLMLFAPAWADSRGSTVYSGDGTALDLRLLPEDLEHSHTTSRPDFTGLWVLDRNNSDDPKEVLEAARPSRGGFPGPGSGSDGFGGGTGRGSGPSGGPGGPPGGGPMGHGPRDGLEPMHDLFVDELDIVHREPLMEITTAGHGKRKVYTDFRGSSVSAMGGRDQRVSTGGWEGNRFVIETTTGGGRQIIQRFRLLTDPRRLEVVTELPAPGEQGKSIEVKQVFLSKPH